MTPITNIAARPKRKRMFSRVDPSIVRADVQSWIESRRLARRCANDPILYRAFQIDLSMLDLADEDRQIWRSHRGTTWIARNWRWGQGVLSSLGEYALSAGSGGGNG